MYEDFDDKEADAIDDFYNEIRKLKLSTLTEEEIEQEYYDKYYQYGISV
jgi:hypothetical protein